MGKQLIPRYAQLLSRLGTSPVGQRLVRGAFWVTLGTVLSRGIALLSSVITARLLGKEAFGELGLIQSTVGMMSVLGGMGFGVTATRFLAQLRESNPERAGRILGVSIRTSLWAGIVLALLTFIAAGQLARAYDSPGLESSFRVSSLWVLAGVVAGVQAGGLAGLESFRKIATIGAIAGTISGCLQILGAWLAGVPGVVGGLACGMAVQAVMNWRALTQEAAAWGIPVQLSGRSGEMAVVWHFSVPALFAQSVVVPVNWLVVTLLAGTENGFSELGILNAVNQVFAVVLFLPSLLGQAVLPVLSERLRATGSRGVLPGMLAASITNGLVVIPVIAFGLLFRKTLMASFGEGFESGTDAMTITLVTGGVLALQTPVAQLIIASGRMWLGFLTNLAWAILFVGLTIVLRDEGTWGVVVARLASYLAHGVWTAAAAWWILKTWRGEDGRVADQAV